VRILKNIFIPLLASSLVLAALPAAALVGTWSTPVNLSALGQNAGGQQVTVDSTGLATAVWARSNGTEYIIQSSTSLSGGAWTTPVDVSVAGQYSQHPQVTVDSTGLVTAVWESSSVDNIIQSSTRPRGGTWSTPVNVSPLGNDANDPQVTVDSTGLATAIWSFEDSSGYDIIQSSKRPRGGNWSAPVNLSAGVEDARDPQLTVDSTGLVTAVWETWGGSFDIIQSSTSQSGGAWSLPIDINALGLRDAYTPQLTVDSTGLVTAVWETSGSGGDTIQSSARPRGGSWTTPVNLSAAGQDAYDAQVTVDSTGLVTAVWFRWNGNYDIIQSSTSLSGGSWTTPVDLSSPGEDAYEAEVTVDSSGLVTAIWYRFSGNDRIIQSRTSQSGGTWSATVDLTPAGVRGTDPELTVDSTGLVTAVWALYNGTEYIIQSSQILNQIPSQPTPTPPTLAKTGAEVDWLLLGSLIAVVAGAGLFALGRGRRTD
jgi:hypothetical protein